MIRLKPYTILVTGLVIIFLFQNCGQTPVELSQFSSEAGAHSAVDIQGKLCLQPDFKLVSFFIVNMSMKPGTFSMEPDSDRDGLSDSFEIKKGFDPYKARSRGQVLDGVCFYLTQGNQCENLNIKCTGVENEMGLSDCDINALKLQINDGQQLGLDSDEDGIPDKIELLYELDPAVDDALLDYDSDNLTNLEEATQGSHPRQEQSTEPQFAEQLVTQKVARQDTICAGEEWIFDSLNQRVFTLNKHLDEDLKKNHIWIVALSEQAQSTLVVNRSMQYIKLELLPSTLHPQLIFNSEDFKMGENDFFRGGSE